MGSSKTGSKGCWLLVNGQMHRGFSSSLLLTFFMQLQCLFLTVSQCLCLRVLLCMCECEYAGGLACSKSRLSEVGEADAGTIYISAWHQILCFLSTLTSKIAWYEIIVLNNIKSILTDFSASRQDKRLVHQTY